MTSDEQAKDVLLEVAGVGDVFAFERRQVFLPMAATRTTVEARLEHEEGTVVRTRPSGWIAPHVSGLAGKKVLTAERQVRDTSACYLLFLILFLSG